MDAATIAAYDRPVPRYTSYPTAAQFSADVGPAEHACWLGALGGATAALYLHVPFCEQLCWYCACHTMAMRREGSLEAYAAALMRELELVADAAPDLMIGAIEWGGGTPSQLGPERLVRIGRRLASLFDRRAGAEISMEADPRYCTAELVEAMATIGVTRVSFGVQDFDERVQQAIHRPQSFDVTATALTRLRMAGLRRINIDLVYGLPCQTLETLERTLDQAISLGPDRFAVFAYAHVPWMKPHQKLIDARSLPDAQARAAMAELVAERLIAGGYRPIGLDHYARPTDPLACAAATGGLRRTFQGYVADDAAWIVGVGASAISSLPGGHSQNTVDVAQYMAAIEAGRFATVRGVAVDADDRLRGEIISRLMCGFEADVAGICRRHAVPADAFLASIPGLEPLRRDGLVALEDGHLTVTERGRPLVRSICAAFDRYYTGIEGRHARAI